MNCPLTIADLSSPQEAAFVTALLDLGGPQHATAAAMRAGYGSTPEEAERAAAFLLGASRISRVIVAEIKARFDTAAAAAYATLLEVCADQRAPANARISAAQEILNRSSIGPTVSRSAVLNANVKTVEALLDELDRHERGEAATPVGATGLAFDTIGAPDGVTPHADESTDEVP